jgi:hypothetical protein
MVALYVHSSIGLYGTVCKYIIKYRVKFTLLFTETSMWTMEAICKKWRSLHEEIVLKKIVNSRYYPKSE